MVDFHVSRGTLRIVWSPMVPTFVLSLSRDLQDPHSCTNRLAHTHEHRPTVPRSPLVSVVVLSAWHEGREMDARC